MPDPCASQATWSKEQEPVLCWTQTLCFCWELPVVISTLVLFGWLVSFCLFVVFFFFVCLFLTYGFVFDWESPYLPWLNEENGFTPIFLLIPRPIENQNPIRRQKGQECEPDQNFLNLKNKNKTKPSGSKPSGM